MTISRFLTWVMIRIIAAVSVGYAIWIAVSEPLGRQPALVNHAAYGVDGPSGFDQAHEVSLKIHAKGGAR